MYYHSYDLPSAVTEEGLASVVCARVNESVKDYLGGVADYVARCQKTIDEQQETIDMLTSDKEALTQQVAELKECPAGPKAGRRSWPRSWSKNSMERPLDWRPKAP